MKKLKVSILALALGAVMFTSCNAYKNANKSERGAAIGVAGGAVAGGVIGKITGNTALGSIIGAAVGGGAGYVIGKKMDKQAEDIKEQIPDAKVQRVEEGIVVEFNSKVLFGFDQSSLTDASRNTLNNLITILNKYPQTNLEVQGHTDNTGAASYNMTLSVKRATAVSDYLKANGIAGSRLTVKGFGETVPKYDNNTEDGRAQNRRVEFLITANDQMKADAAQEAKDQGK
ncbi:Outer membrane protein OmpA [Arachidicoccus rhizosphaerae]|jgi:outer membrane protein OmpA-like peptidoglycan-associated protein|uniref:Outer membrane protein OmpA n=1 Tax=Arachidicoccus rhizosphaerae TaxID=551991 RepID=A0A1H4C1S8_9BACT|nr:OmpA family protein [Arachidicoccus rhizosphaerae]SEA54042.1 Outer membrane protein OmpA [Arachidicoccus rhizosphaerae]